MALTTTVIRGGQERRKLDPDERLGDGDDGVEFDAQTYAAQSLHM